MTARNPHQLGPWVPPYPERDRQSYTETIGANPRREGPRQASEELVERGNLQGAFTQGVSSEGEHRYVAEIARGRSPVADPNLMDRSSPAWDAVDAPQLRAFANAMALGEPGQATPYSFEPRRGANYDHHSPLDAMARGERQNTQYAAKIAPANGGRGRRSIADVTEVL